LSRRPAKSTKLLCSREYVKAGGGQFEHLLNSTRTSADADKPAQRVRGQSRLLNIKQYHFMLGIAS